MSRSATYITKVLLYQGMSSLVHHIVVMVLQHLNAVQASQLFHQKAQFLRLAKLLCCLKRQLLKPALISQFQVPSQTEASFKK